MTEEITDADHDLKQLLTVAAPDLLGLSGVGIEVAGQMLVTGDNPDRLRREAAFAHLCGVAPVPASTGRSRRHRLNRGGDRAANNALYIVVLGRLRHDARTRAYAQRRTRERLSKLEKHRAMPVTAADLAIDVRRVVARWSRRGPLLGVMPRRKDWERRVCGASTRRFRLVPGVMKDLEPRM